MRETPRWIGRVKELLQNLFMIPVRVRRRWRRRNYRRAWEGALQAVRSSHEKVLELRLDNHQLIHNVGLYVLLLEYDLGSLSDDMVRATNDTRRKYVARQMAVLLYEGIQDLPELLGRRFRKGLEAIGVDSSGVKELNAISHQLNAYKLAHQKELQIVRNLVGAHRDRDAVAQLRLLDSLDPLAIFRLEAEFYVPFRELADWLTRLTLATGTSEVVLQQFLRREPREGLRHAPRLRLGAKGSTAQQIDRLRRPRAEAQRIRCFVPSVPFGWRAEYEPATSGGGVPMLSVTFQKKKPSSARAETVLRACISKVAKKFEIHGELLANAWYNRLGAGSAADDDGPLPLLDGSTHLSFEPSTGRVKTWNEREGLTPVVSEDSERRYFTVYTERKVLVPPYGKFATLDVVFDEPLPEADAYPPVIDALRRAVEGQRTRLSTTACAKIGSRDDPAGQSLLRDGSGRYIRVEFEPKDGQLRASDGSVVGSM